MPRNANGEFYLSPGTAAVKDEVAYSAHVNQRFDDLKADANRPRPVLYGGTGAGSASAARANLGVRAATDTPSLTGANAFAGGNTFGGVTVFNDRVDISRTEQGKLRLMGSDIAVVEAFGADGTRAGTLTFDHAANLFRVWLDAKGAQPSARVELTRAGVLSVNGQPIYHTGNRPSAADVGALPASGKATDADRLDGLDSAAFARSARTVTGGTALTGGGALTGNVVINADIASEVEALGTANDKVMTPARTRQAIFGFSIGRDQSWQVGNRSTNTTYQNATSSPIMVCVSLVSGTGAVLCGPGATSMLTIYSSNAWPRDSFNFIVPPGHYYRLNSDNQIHFWSELR